MTSNTPTYKLAEHTGKLSKTYEDDTYGLPIDMNIGIGNQSKYKSDPWTVSLGAFGF